MPPACIPILPPNLSDIVDISALMELLSQAKAVPNMTTFIANFHSNASSFLESASAALFEEEKSSNILLAHALEKAAKESNIRPLSSQTTPLLGRQVLPPTVVRREFWITVWTTDFNPRPVLLLSCINGKLGAYPIFIWSPRANAGISQQDRREQVAVLIRRLHMEVQPQQVFSVFGQTELVVDFAEVWKATSGFETEPHPFYDALLTYCAKDTFRPASTFREASTQLPLGHDMRAANMEDLKFVAERCREFSEDSIYFPLDIQGSEIEAELLIREQQVWVYTVGGETVSICAVTRITDNVAGMTKVFTAPNFRKKGFAECLVRMVTARLLEEKSAVVLYVGVDNDAQHVYDKVGYIGLCGNGHPDVEHVLELGFKNTVRGHW